MRERDVVINVYTQGKLVNMICLYHTISWREKALRLVLGPID